MLSLLKRPSDVCMWIGGIFMVAMMLHVTADVVLKYALNRPISGTLEIVSAYYMVAGVFFPMAAVEMARGSIGVDVAYQFAPRPLKILFTAIALLGSTAVYFGLAWTSGRDAMRSFASGEMMMGTVFVSIWPSRFILPVSLFIGGLVCLAYLIALFVSAEQRNRLISLDGMPDGGAADNG